MGEGESTVSRLIGQYPFLYILLKLFLANPKNIRQTQLMGSLQFDASNLSGIPIYNKLLSYLHI